MMVGCASTSQVRFSQIGPVGSPKSESQKIDVFFTKKPDREYREIGILSKLTWKYQPDDIVHVTALKQEAREIEADAIIMLESQTEIATNYVTKQNYQGKIYRAMAIAFK